MSHHYSGPDFSFPHEDARLDLTDLHAFPKPGDAGKSILIMNVHPAVGENAPGPTPSMGWRCLGISAIGKLAGSVPGAQRRKTILKPDVTEPYRRRPRRRSMR